MEERKTKNAMTNTKNEKASKKAKGTRRANVHRKTNKRWKYIEGSYCYRKAATEHLFDETTKKIEAELLDGIFLKLRTKNQMKSSHVQERMLRRIVEKRQAQVSHKTQGRSEDLSSLRATIACTSKCMARIWKSRHAVA